MSATHPGMAEDSSAPPDELAVVDITELIERQRPGGTLLRLVRICDWAAGTRGQGARGRLKPLAVGDDDHQRPTVYLGCCCLQISGCSLHRASRARAALRAASASALELGPGAVGCWGVVGGWGATGSSAEALIKPVPPSRTVSVTTANERCAFMVAPCAFRPSRGRIVSPPVRGLHRAHGAPDRD